MQSTEIIAESPDPPLSPGLGRSAVRHGPTTTLQEHNSGQGSRDGNDLYDVLPFHSKR